jgi:hypothetical protein
MLIIGTMSISAAKLIPQYKRDNYGRTSALNRDLIFSALNTFYGEHCTDSSKPAPTISGLISSGYLQSGEHLVNSYGSEYTVAINWGPPAVLEVRSLMAASDLVVYRGVLRPQTVDASTYVWTQNPNFGTQQNQVFENEFVAMYTNSCE